MAVGLEIGMESSPSFVVSMDQLKAQALREIAGLMSLWAGRFPADEQFRGELEERSANCELRAALTWSPG